MVRPSRFRHLLIAAFVLAVWVSAAEAQQPLLVDRGGRVLTTPQVSAIYLGNYWLTTQGASDRGRIDAFLPTWLAGPSITDVLAQYRVTSASFTSSEVVQGASPVDFTDADAQALVQQELAAGRITGAAQAVHVIYLPPNTVLTFGGNSSTRKLAGYHSSYIDVVTLQPVYYAVVVYNQGSNGLDFNGNPQDNNTIITSRVLAGAFTNPDVGVGTPGWVDDTFGEVGDVAFGLSTDASLGDTFVLQNGFAVVLLWSNKDARLTAGTAQPPAAVGAVLTVSPASQTAAPGASAVFTVSSAAAAAETVTLGVDQLPANTTATFAAPSLAPGGSTTLTIAVDAAATLATTTFTVTGTSATINESVPVTLTIGTSTTPPAAQANFTMTATPTSQEMVRGGDVVTYTITTTGDGNTTIKLKVQHLRRGLRASLSRARIAAGETVTVTLRAHRDAKRKTYTFELKGSGDTGDVRVPLTLTVK